MPSKLPENHKVGGVAVLAFLFLNLIFCPLARAESMPDTGAGGDPVPPPIVIDAETANPLPTGRLWLSIGASPVLLSGESSWIYGGSIRYGLGSHEARAFAHLTTPEIQRSSAEGTYFTPGTYGGGFGWKSRILREQAFALAIGADAYMTRFEWGGTPGMGAGGPRIGGDLQIPFTYEMPYAMDYARITISPRANLTVPVSGTPAQSPARAPFAWAGVVLAADIPLVPPHFRVHVEAMPGVPGLAGMGGTPPFTFPLVGELALRVGPAQATLGLNPLSIVFPNLPNPTRPEHDALVGFGTLSLTL